MSQNSIPVEGIHHLLWPEKIARAEGESDDSFIERVKSLQTRGFYVSSQAPTLSAEDRANRKSPTITLWLMEPKGAVK